MKVLIRKLEKNEIDKGLDLTWRVFQEFEAPDYSAEGVAEFCKSIHDENYLSKLQMYGAFAEEELLGIMATRNQGTHVALFFVDGRYQGQGVGRQLFERALADCPIAKMTVNSSPYAVPVYHKLGFRDTDSEQVYNGVRFIPMVRLLR